jgi:hypothetical protein
LKTKNRRRAFDGLLAVIVWRVRYPSAKRHRRNDSDHGKPRMRIAMLQASGTAT